MACMGLSDGWIQNGEGEGRIRCDSPEPWLEQMWVVIY